MSHALTLTAVLFVVGAVFFASVVATQVFARSFGRYQERYLAESLTDLSDMFLFIEARQLGLVGLALMALGASLSLVLGPVVGIVGAALGLLSPPLLVRFYKQRRLENFDKQLPDALQTLAGAMRSGLTFRQAMAETAATSPAPLSQEFALFSREMQLGTSIDDALTHLGERVLSQELDLFVSAAQISLKVGGNMSEMFDGMSATVRERFRLEGRIRTLTAQGKLQGVIIGLMPILVWLGFDFFRPDLTRPMLHHWFGVGLIATVAVMELCGALVIRHIVRIEL